MKDVKNLPSITPVRLPTIVPVRTPRRVVLLTSTALPALAFNTSVRLPTNEINILPPIFFDDSIRLPTGGLDKDRVINCIAAFVSKMLHKLTPEYSHDWFETTVLKWLREDRSPFSARTVAAAESGDEIADRALRRVFVEITRGELSSGPGQHLYVREYGEHAVLRGPCRHRPGRRLQDNFVRDPEMCALIWEISRALHKFGIRPTRNPATMDKHSADAATMDKHSAISLLVAALASLGHHFEEKTLQAIWLGPTGKLVREIFSATIACG